MEQWHILMNVIRGNCDVSLFSCIILYNELCYRFLEMVNKQIGKGLHNSMRPLPSYYNRTLSRQGKA